MPIFTRWCLPLVILFLIAVIFNADKSLIILSFILAYCGFIVTFIRSVAQSRITPKNKKHLKIERYYR